jgi:hypothetical protein
LTGHLLLNHYAFIRTKITNKPVVLFGQQDRYGMWLQLWHQLLIPDGHLGRSQMYEEDEEKVLAQQFKIDTVLSFSLFSERIHFLQYTALSFSVPHPTV